MPIYYALEWPNIWVQKNKTWALFEEQTKAHENSGRSCRLTPKRLILRITLIYVVMSENTAQ